MKAARGFTLIEVIVAAAILGMAGAALFALFSKSLSNLRKIDDVRQYQLATQKVMNCVLLISQLPPGGRAQGNFDQTGAHWVVDVTPWMPATLDDQPPNAVMKIDVQVSWPTRFGQRTLAMETVKQSSLSYTTDDLQPTLQTLLSK